MIVAFADRATQVRSDRAGKVDYFTEFLKKKPQGVIDSTYLSRDGNIAMRNGM